MIITRYNKADPGLDPSEGILRIYSNGDSDNDYQSATSSLFGSMINPELTIGVQSSDINHLDIDIGEILIFDRPLKTKEREEVEAYLSQKWGIKLEN